MVAGGWSADVLRDELIRALKGEHTEREKAEKFLDGMETLPQDAPRTAELSLALMDMGRLDSTRGAVRVIEGDAGGWEQLQIGGLWKALEQRVLALLWERDTREAPRPRSNPRDLAIATLHLLTFQRPEARWGAEQLRLSLDGGGFGATRKYPLSVFALWLAETNDAAGPVAFESEQQSVYSEIPASWADDRRLQGAIDRMCAYHMARTIDRTDSYLWMEFEFPPYAIFAVEYLALCRARQKSGRSTPRPENPLLSVPLAYVPPESERDVHLKWSWLESVLRSMREETLGAGAKG